MPTTPPSVGRLLLSANRIANKRFHVLLECNHLLVLLKWPTIDSRRCETCEKELLQYYEGGKRTWAQARQMLDKEKGIR